MSYRERRTRKDRKGLTPEQMRKRFPEIYQNTPPPPWNPETPQTAGPVPAPRKARTH